MKNSRIKNGIMRIVQGIIIGAGAILPGISGGVLAVVFGIYRPAMELLTHCKACSPRRSPRARSSRSTPRIARQSAILRTTGRTMYCSAAA